MADLIAPTIVAIRLNTPHSRAAASQISTAAGLFILALVLTLVTRFTWLERRVMHTDEAVQAVVYLAPMLSGGSYEYHSADGHGPLLVYSTRALCWITGVDSPVELTEFLLRLTPALYSLGLVLAVWLMADGLGRGAPIWAMLFTAISPMLVYYSRYYIMEVPLVFMTALAIAAGWRYAVSRHPAWMALVGVAVGLMHVAKETFLIQVIAAGLAVVATWGIEFFLSGTGFGQINRRSMRSNPPLALHIMLAAVVAGLVSFVLFSGFFSKPGQFFDSLKSYVEYARRAEGAGHEKPWWWYLTLLWGRRDADGFPVGEWPLIVLAVIGAGKAFFTTPSRYENVRLQRFLALYAVALLCGYSLIAYKTPWSILGAGHAILLLAGIGAAALLSAPWGQFCRLVVWSFLASTTIYLGIQLWRQNYQWPADPEHNPYVYSHTSPDLLRLVRQVNEAANSRGGDPQDFSVFIIHPEHGYPLPWYFRRFGGGATNEFPEDNTLLSQADVIITTPEATSLIGALVASSHREVQETWFLRADTPLRALFRRSLLGDLPNPPPEAQPEPEPELEPELEPEPETESEPEPADQSPESLQPAEPAVPSLPESTPPDR